MPNAAFLASAKLSDHLDGGTRNVRQHRQRKLMHREKRVRERAVARCRDEPNHHTLQGCREFFEAKSCPNAGCTDLHGCSVFPLLSRAVNRTFWTRAVLALSIQVPPIPPNVPLTRGHMFLALFQSASISRCRGSLVQHVVHPSVRLTRLANAATRIRLYS